MEVKSKSSHINLFIYLGIFCLFSFILYIGSSILMPVCISIFFYIILEPIIKPIKKTTIPLIIADFVMIFLVLFLLIFFSFVLYKILYTILDDYQKYIDRFNVLVNELENLIKKHDLDFIDINSIYDSINKNIQSLLFKTSMYFTNGFSKFLGKLFIITLFLFFFILDSGKSEVRLKKSLEKQKYILFMKLFRGLRQSIIKYVIIKFFMGLCTAFVVYIILKFVLPLPFPIVWAFLVFLFNWVPSVGSVLITFLIFIFGIVEYFPNYNIIFLIGFLTTLPQIIIGNIIDPKITGDNVNLSPGVVLISLLYWGFIWGLPGMFLSVPLTVVLKNILEHTKNFSNFAKLMGK